MSLVSAFFYLFSTVAIVSAFMVVAARNPVHSVLFLVLTFFNAACLFVLMGAEFLAMILVIVYVGAVAVLFLFIVMMLCIDFVELRQGFMNYLPIGSAIVIVLLVELIFAFGAWTVSPYASQFVHIPMSGEVSNTQAIGQVLYTQYVYYFQSAGLILLVSMIGSIVLSLHHRTGIRRQDIAQQVARCPATSIEIRKVESGQGLL